ncbi:Protein of unknown function DUF3537 [Dillenia turbinata]|uniref:Uncharacterized protein n=1 Tax=Dillenia turbinata TaxID=194707 RepID=A0AAN8V7X9_9MAGN
MADPPIETEETIVELETHLLGKDETQEERQEKGGDQSNEVEGYDHQLEKTVQRLENLLRFLGFYHSSALSICLSLVAFLVLGVSIPLLMLELSDSSGIEKFHIKEFELDIVASQACLAGVSLACISHKLRKYGIRKFIFVDQYGSEIIPFREEYIQKISDSFRFLLLWVLPCFLLKSAREVICILYLPHESLWLSISISVALIISWTYVTTVSLTASIVFHLVCNLQIIHFENYGKLLERESDVLVFMEEHIRLRQNLSKISHRFRIYLLLEFLVVTASQFVTLLQTTGYSGMITIINGGDFAASSIVQVVGLTLCLHTAAKISHRAQGIASHASKWHALVTCTSNDSFRVSSSSSNLDAANPLSSLRVNSSESDLDSVDYVAIPMNTQLASYMSSYHKRQAFVMYLQSNPGGITIFGWTVDRALINTIFFIELSLILFLLGKTLVFTSG